MTLAERTSPAVSRLCQVAATAVAFAVLNRVGWYFQIDNGVSIFYPATAVDVIACMYFGPIGALGVFLGCLVTPWQSHETLRMTAISGLLNVAEGMIPYLVFRSRRSLYRDLHDFRSLVAFLVFGCAVNSAVSAIAGNVLLIPGAVDMRNVFTWWVSDFSAALLLGMPLLAFAGDLLDRFSIDPRKRQRRTLVNFVEITAAVILLGWAATTAIQNHLVDLVDQERSREEHVLLEAHESLRANPAMNAQQLLDSVDGENRRIWREFRERRERIHTVINLMQDLRLIILLLACASLIFRIGRPLERMHKEVARLRNGEPFDAANVQSNFVELRGLAEALDETTRELAARESALRDQTARAVAASQAKSEFLAKMSHELRTPLNSIIGFSDLLLEKRDGLARDRLDNFVDNISRSAHNLLRMINDLLDVAKVEAGRMEFRYELVDLRRLVSNSVITGGPLFRGKQQRLDTELPPEPMLVSVDPDRTEQIFLNLLSNANKFTDAGKTIRVVASMDSEYCCVEVHDEGIGIPADQHAFIFEDFAQVNHPRRVSGGTGLGLGLARKFAEAQGGSLTLRSVEGRGSTFTVRLPRQKTLAALAG